MRERKNARNKLNIMDKLRDGNNKRQKLRRNKQRECQRGKKRGKKSKWEKTV
jgi:hypothetical protein